MTNGKNSSAPSKSRTGCGVNSAYCTLVRHGLNWMVREARHLFTLQPSARSWRLALASAIAMGGPALLGAWGHALKHGLSACIGALVILYLPQARLGATLRSLLTSSSLLLACYGLGALSGPWPTWQAPTLALVTALATGYCRAFRLGGPPGSLFLVIAASVGASRHALWPIELSSMAWVAAGCLFALGVAWLYAAFMPSATPASASLPASAWQQVLPDAVAIGALVGLAMALAQSLQLSHPHWVPISCLAVIQGGSMREIWRKQLHRMVGTSLGLILMSALFASKLSDWQVAAWIVLLSFAIEITVARHYATAVVFITPLTILLADAGPSNTASWSALAQSRWLDTALGCLVGLVGGFVLHWKRR